MVSGVGSANGGAAERGVMEQQLALEQQHRVWESGAHGRDASGAGGTMGAGTAGGDAAGSVSIPFPASVSNSAYLQQYQYHHSAPNSPFDPAMNLPTPQHHVPSFHHSYNLNRAYSSHGQGYKMPTYEAYHPFSSGLAYSSSHQQYPYPGSATQSTAPSSSTSYASTYNPQQYQNPPPSESSRWPLGPSPAQYALPPTFGSAPVPVQPYQPPSLPPSWPSIQERPQFRVPTPVTAPLSALDLLPPQPSGSGRSPTDDTDAEAKRPSRKRSKTSSIAAAAAAAERAEQGDDDYEDDGDMKPVTSSSRTGGGKAGNGRGAKAKGRRASGSSRSRGPPPRTWLCHEEGCDKSFARPSALKSHARTHSGDRPYACPRCDRPFSVIYNLQRHMKTHPEIDVFNIRPADIPNLRCDRLDPLVGSAGGDASSEGDEADEEDAHALDDLEEDEEEDVSFARRRSLRSSFGGTDEQDVEDGVEEQLQFDQSLSETATAPSQVSRGSYVPYASSAVSYPSTLNPSQQATGAGPTVYAPYVLAAPSGAVAPSAVSPESTMFASSSLGPLPLSTITEQPSSTNASRPTSDDETGVMKSEMSFPARSPVPQPIEMRRLHQNGQHHYAPYETTVLTAGAAIGEGTGVGEQANSLLAMAIPSYSFAPSSVQGGDVLPSPSNSSHSSTSHLGHAPPLHGLSPEQEDSMRLASPTTYSSLPLAGADNDDSHCHRQHQQLSHSQSHPNLYSSAAQRNATSLSPTSGPSPSLPESFRLSFARHLPQSNGGGAQGYSHSQQSLSPYSQPPLQLVPSPTSTFQNTLVASPPSLSAFIPSPPSALTGFATALPTHLLQQPTALVGGSGGGEGRGAEKSLLSGWDSLSRTPPGVEVTRRGDGQLSAGGTPLPSG